jgi:hypothetical protein
VRSRAGILFRCLGRPMLNKQPFAMSRSCLYIYAVVYKSPVMRWVCVFVMLCHVGWGESRFVDKGGVVSNAGSAFPLVNGFLKVAYSRIEEADVKSLTANMIDSYSELCDKFGARVVATELRALFESQSMDLEISMARMQKLGGLLKHSGLAERVSDEEDGGGSRRLLLTGGLGRR